MVVLTKENLSSVSCHELMFFSALFILVCILILHHLIIMLTTYPPLEELKKYDRVSGHKWQ